MKKALKILASKFGYKVERVKSDTADYYHKQQYLESNEFKYILWLDRVYQKIERVPGVIVELGVAYGRNAIIFSKLADGYGQGDTRKYYGFDTFSGYTEYSLLQDEHLSSKTWKQNSKEKVISRLARADVLRKCELIEGDISKEVPKFAKRNKNLKIALLYVDCNAYQPAIDGLRALFPFMVPGSVICVDEKLPGSETRALYDFCEEAGLRVCRDAGSFAVPAYTLVS